MGMLHGDRDNAPHGYYEKANFNSSPKYEDCDDKDNQTDNDIMESFVDLNPSSNYFNMNLLLKSLLFGCLFYLLLDMQKPIINMMAMKVSKDNQLCVLGALFAILYYLLNLII